MRESDFQPCFTTLLTNVLMTKRSVIVIGLAVLALVIACRVIRPVTDQDRYAHLCRSGASFQTVWKGKPNVLNWLEAGMHWDNPSNYFRSRLEAESRALLVSGYFVEITVPVPDLRAKLAQVKSGLSNTAQQAGAYYQAKLDWSSNEVRLICRRQDIPLWEKALGKESGQ